jgi:hypothetical protein
MAAYYIEADQCYTKTSVEEHVTMQILNRDGILSHQWQPTDRANGAADDSYWARRNTHGDDLITWVCAFTWDVLHHMSTTSHAAVAKHVVASNNFVVCCS